MRGLSRRHLSTILQNATVQSLWERRQRTEDELKTSWRSYIDGWWNYFGYANWRGTVTRLSGWIRRHMRKKLLATLAQSARTRQRVASAGREGAQCRGVVEPLRAMADSPSRGGSTSVKDGTTKPRKLWSTTGTREQAVRHKAIRPRLLDSAAV